MEMNNSLFASTLGLLISAVIAIPQATLAAPSDDVKLALTCKLERGYLKNPGDQQPVFDDITPKPQPSVPVSVLVQDGESKPSQLQWTVKTPDGKITVNANAFAWDVFGQFLSTDVHTATTFESAQLTFFKDLEDTQPVPYSDLELKRDVRSMISAGKTKDGFAKSNYYTTCTLQRMK
jgi:hypothetical protein